MFYLLTKYAKGYYSEKKSLTRLSTESFSSLTKAEAIALQELKRTGVENVTIVSLKPHVTLAMGEPVRTVIKEAPNE